MKSNVIAVAGAVFVMIFCALPGLSEFDVAVGVNFRDLNDYGEWVHVHGAGSVWRPDADQDWQPFRYGRWVYSNDGWMWDSYEPFGWIVYHYGNWYYDEEQGWVWIPGYEWSPAQVQWYVTDHEIGWAPLLPSGYSHSLAGMHWLFCPTPFFASGEIGNHIEIRPYPARSEMRRHAYPGAPRLEFVKHFSRSPVVRIAPRKVRVEDGHHAFIKLEFGNRPEADFVVHVGPKFRRGQDRPEVQPRPYSEVRPERPAEVPGRVEPEERRVIVHPVQQERREVRSRVESGQRINEDTDNDRQNNNDNNSSERKVRGARQY
jgi:hypothetical protein